MFTLSDKPLDIGSLQAQLADPRAGGYASFEGWVRNHNEGRNVLRLEYEAYAVVAQREAEKIIEEAKARFGIYNAACVHRTGGLEIGDIAVWVGVSSAHRDEAFDACRYIIDEVKHRLPIWKKEHYADGDSGWVNCERCAAAGHAYVHSHCAHGHEISGQNGTASEMQYYARQVCLPELGATGQQKLRDARVLVVGAGGLGCPALQYLVAAGVGHVGICDGDSVDASNLHRQPLYAPEDVSVPKAERAASWLRKQNPFVTIETFNFHLDVRNVEGVLQNFDIVLDCTDNFETKYLLNDAAVHQKKTFILASIYQYEGQLFVYDPRSNSACLRCLWPEMPEPGCVGTCAEVGVLGAVPGILGAYQAMEALKHLLSLDGALKNAVLYHDLLTLKILRVPVMRNADCPACGAHPAGGFASVPDFSDIEVEDPGALGVFQWVDIREDAERSGEALPPGAVHCPGSMLAEDSSPLAPDAAYVLVCQRGIRSKYLAHKLRHQGFAQVYSLKGGVSTLNRIHANT